MKNLKKTKIYEEHIRLGARMVPFSGWEMPLQYSGIIDEHRTVRTQAGLFDVSHMGEIFVWGKDAVNFLQKLVPQDISRLAAGNAVYSQLTNDNAGIIDDLIIYRLENKADNPNFLLIVNASRIKEDLSRIESEKKQCCVEIENQSDKLTMLALQGPLASDLIEDLGLNKHEQPLRFAIKEAKIGNFKVFIAGTGYTGEEGFEILIENEHAQELWLEILSKGQKHGIKPIGLAARDTLRLEASMLLYGQDINENTTPVEASLGWSIPKDKQEDYSGRDVILSQLAHKNLSKVLIGFKMLDRSIPRHDCEIYSNNEKVGIVTSGGVAPSLGINIGMGYINAKIASSPGTKLEIEIRGKFHPAEIVERPFYRRSKKN